ncbi:thioredoxin family protein [Mariniblastus fucicola]|uniref:Thiol-disulfide oxidoreductase n=1 Tax=Mariniblastus fucicola TaxID=980251 RepID=A0A5B9PKR8_9BACT|nr:thioredoxin family protein [Mariniblastus fucicola]QEG23251.1 thiol-disulfide oxidoreductase [Mariniblastus fucicola]
MALTESTMLKLGSPMPAFELPNVLTGETVTANDFAGKPLVVMFICNHCPYVIHLSESLAEVTRGYMESGVGVIAISSNDVAEYPADSPEKMKEELKLRGYSFPYLYDQTQKVAHDFTAACTPDFFLFDADHKLVYRGRYDETRPTRIRSGVYESDNVATGKELTAAVNAVLNSETVPKTQLPSLGCNIKWKEGNEPQH